MAKTKSKPNVLEFFRKNYEMRLGGFTKSEPFTNGQGKYAANVTNDYDNYVAPETFVGASPAKKKGGSVKMKKCKYGC